MEARADARFFQKFGSLSLKVNQKIWRSEKRDEGMTRKFSVAVIASAISLLTATSALALSITLEPELQWGYYQYNDDQNRGRSTSELVFAIPETDAIAFRASCAAGSSGSFSVVQFGVGESISGMQDGDDINISFSAHGFQRTMRGSVVGTQAEFGISGVELTIDNDDRFWEVMRDQSRVSYAVRGDEYNMSLRGSGRQIVPFLKDCRFYASQFDDQGDVANVPQTPASPPSAPQRPRADADPRWATCELPQNQRSVNSDTPVTVTFRNRSGEYRSVEWIDFNGQPKNYATLNPGEEYTQQTFLTHPWMFTDGPGNCIEIFQPQLGIAVFDIGAKSPGFGPE